MKAVNKSHFSDPYRVSFVLVNVEWAWDEAFRPFCELEKTLWPVIRDGTALSTGKKVIYCLRSKKICLHFLVFLKCRPRFFSDPRSCRGRYRDLLFILPLT